MVKKYNYENEELNELLTKFNEMTEKKTPSLYDDLKCLMRAKNIMLERNYSSQWIDNVIETLEQEWVDMVEEERTISNRIEEIRETCDHEWKSDGHDSHYEYFVCKKCGKMDKS